jgi:predicted ATP-grasp superfamily ATP-dependent carboligase/protein-tyrosine phosphatase
MAEISFHTRRGIGRRMSLEREKAKKILLTDGNYKHTWAAARALSLAGYKVDVIGGGRSTSSKSRYVEKNVFSRLKLLNENLDSFVDLIRTEKYDLIIGIGATSINFLSDNQNIISHFSKVLLPPAESLQVCLHKNETVDFALRQGIEVPQTYMVESYQDFLHVESKISFPIIIKSAVETLKAYPTIYLDRAEELNNEYIRNIFQNNSCNLIQERIYGKGEAFFAIYNKGTLIDFMMHERIRENPMTGGPSTLARTINKVDLAHAGKTLLDKLNWHGFAMVEFKRDKNGKLFLMEINPKFWGSLDLAISAGVNFPLLAAEIALKDLRTPLKYHAIETTFQWPFDGDIKIALKHPKLIIPVFFDLLNPKIKKNIYLNDLSPTINSLINQLFDWLLGFKLFGNFKSLAHKVNTEGLKFGVIRWFTETAGVPLSRYSKINKDIYIGGKLSRLGILFLRLSRIKAILNLQSEFDDQLLGLRDFNYLQIECKEFEEISIQNFVEGVNYIESNINNSGKIYIHCAEGVSRAPSFAAAYLMAHGHQLDNAVDLIKRVRPFINILDNQVHSLELFFEFCKKNRFFK